MKTLSDITSRYPRRDEQDKRVMESLRALGDRVLNLSEVMEAIKSEDMPPFKTRERLLKVGLLRFVGTHRGDQRYRVSQ